MNAVLTALFVLVVLILPLLGMLWDAAAFLITGKRRSERYTRADARADARLAAGRQHWWET